MSLYSETEIEVHGQPESVFEVYADEDRNQTLGFVYGERAARLLAAVCNAPSVAKLPPSESTGKTLLEKLAEIDAALAEGKATPKQEQRGQELVRLANAAPRMLSALGAARELFYTLGDRNTHESRDCFQLCQTCDEAIAHASPNNAWWPVTHDTDGMNGDRAQWAKAALLAFITETGADYADALGDLLCDLMHLSDREPFDFDAALERARDHYAVETGSMPD
jgi:hypothetical protein